MLKPILSGIFLITAVSVFFVWTKPFYADIQALGAERDLLVGLVDNSQEINQIREDLRANYNTISEANKDRLAKLLPAKTDTVKFIMEIEKIAQRNRMALKEIRVDNQNEAAKKDTAGARGGKTAGKANVEFGASAAVSGVGAQKEPATSGFSMKVAGSYGDFYSLLGDLEKNLRLIEIVSISFVPAEVNFYEFNISALIYKGN